MKFNESKQIIETNIESTKNFTIKASSKAFKILSSGLYSNKIRAIIRELSCNAYDSHIAAKNNEPFIVHLPSDLNDNFYVQDFGTGLSEKDIMNLYTTYFDSNKTNSNDFVGALGLGSKSPFSYTDSFSVESIFNNIRTTYIVFIDENDLPSITKINEEKTSEHSGMKISFSVKKEDWWLFYDEARQVLSVFENRPILKGKSNISLPNKVLDFGQKGYVVNYESYSYRNKTYAFMGNILYPIEFEKLDLDEKIKSYVSSNDIIIKFEIGELDITPSREHLSYIKSTKDILKNKIEMVVNDIISKKIDELNLSNDISDFVRRFYKLSNDERKIIHDKGFQPKFQAISKFYNKTNNLYFVTSQDVFKHLNFDNELKTLKSIRFCEIIKKSGVNYLFAMNDTNILSYFSDEWYISFSNNDNLKFKNSDTGEYLIETRFGRKLSNEEKGNIINELKIQLGLDNIVTCDSLNIVKNKIIKNGDAPIKYKKDICEGNIWKIIGHKVGILAKPIIFNKGGQFDFEYEIQNDGNTFYVPCNKYTFFNSNVQKMDDFNYVKWVCKIFSKYYDPNKMKILFCRNKAIEYVKTELKIPNFFEYIQELIKNDKNIKEDLINNYIPVKSPITDIISLFRKMQKEDIQRLDDDELKKLISICLKTNDDINYKDHIEKLFNVRLKDDNWNHIINKYGGLFNILTYLNYYYINDIVNSIIEQLNLIYKEKQNEKL